MAQTLEPCTQAAVCGMLLGSFGNVTVQSSRGAHLARPTRSLPSRTWLSVSACILKSAWMPFSRSRALTPSVRRKLSRARGSAGATGAADAAAAAVAIAVGVVISTNCSLSALSEAALDGGSSSILSFFFLTLTSVTGASVASACALRFFFVAPSSALAAFFAFFTLTAGTPSTDAVPAIPFFAFFAFFATTVASIAAVIVRQH